MVSVLEVHPHPKDCAAECYRDQENRDVIMVAGISSMVAWLREFCRTLEIIKRTLREVVNRVRLCGRHTRGYSRGEVHVYGAVIRPKVVSTVCLYACMLGFCHTLEIITRTSREVVNRVRLCGHHNPESCSRGEVHVEIFPA